MSELSSTFLRECVGYLRDTYLPRLERALEALPGGDLWWRPHAGAITFGTVLLHLEGNVRQWIVSGLGGARDERDRASEFSASDGPDGAILLGRLAQTVQEACRVIEGLDEAALLAEHPIQGERVTGLHAVQHVVEHFAWHTGQALWIAKARAGADHGVAFFDDAKIDRLRNG